MARNGNAKRRTVVKGNEIPAKPLREARLNTHKIFYGITERWRHFNASAINPKDENSKCVPSSAPK